MEQFTIKETNRNIEETERNFVDWVNRYGREHQWNFIRREIWEDSLLHSVSPPDRNISWGDITFYIERDGETLHVATKVSNGLNPPRSEALGYLQVMATAIRERWPQPDDNTSYDKKIRDAGYLHPTDAKKRWKAVIQIYAEWRLADPEVTHKQLAHIMGCSVPHVKRMWGKYKPSVDS